MGLHLTPSQDGQPGPRIGIYRSVRCNAGIVQPVAIEGRGPVGVSNQFAQCLVLIGAKPAKTPPLAIREAVLQIQDGIEVWADGHMQNRRRRRIVGHGRHYRPRVMYATALPVSRIDPANRESIVRAAM
jgi:hypothetical protein